MKQLIIALVILATSAAAQAASSQDSVAATEQTIMSALRLPVPSPTGYIVVAAIGIIAGAVMYRKGYGDLDLEVSGALIAVTLCVGSVILYFINAVTPLSDNMNAAKLSAGLAVVLHNPAATVSNVVIDGDSTTCVIGVPEEIVNTRTTILGKDTDAKKIVQKAVSYQVPARLLSALQKLDIKIAGVPITEAIQVAHR